MILFRILVIQSNVLSLFLIVFDDYVKKNMTKVFNHVSNFESTYSKKNQKQIVVVVAVKNAIKIV